MKLKPAGTDTGYIAHLLINEAPFPGERGWLIGYGVASLLYRQLILIVIVLFVAGQFFVIGVILAIWAVTMQVLWPIAKGLHFVFANPKLNRRRVRSVLLTGGIAFDTPESLEARAEVQENHEFFIYANRLESLQREYKIQKYYVMIFNESVRGLTTGSPVEFFGLKIGEVVDISFEVDYENMTLHIPVLVRIEPERLVPTGDESRLGNESEGMVARGWRGQLATGNVLTGGKVINLVLDPDAPPGETGEWKGYPTFPTVPSSLRNLASDVGRIVDKIEDIPFDRIGENLSETLASINRIVSDPELANAIASLRRMADQLSNDVAPALDSVLNKAEETLDATRKQIDADSVTAHELRRLLMELGDTAQSIRTIVEYLERHPESLIKGKEDQS